MTKALVATAVGALEDGSGTGCMRVVANASAQGLLSFVREPVDLGTTVHAAGQADQPGAADASGCVGGLPAALETRDLRCAVR